MAIERYFSSIAQPTTLVGNIGTGALTITVSALTGYPASFPYTIAVDYAGSAEELMEVTSAASTTLTVTRAVDGTSAQTHSNGAAIRHVVSARDFTNYQNHQNASSGVHGVTGNVVGTSDTQVLSNKTLTSPTINGGALSGTFTGSPTLSGDILHSGNPTLSGTVTLSGTQNFTGAAIFDGTASAMFRRASATNIALQSRLTADTGPRWLSQANGVNIWGDGAGNNDTNLYRQAANTLQTDDTFSSNQSASTNVSFSAIVSGDTFDRYREYASGLHEWGTGAAARDTNLYRNGVGELKTDGILTVAGVINGGTNLTTAAWNTYTPTWTAATTNPVLGNGTLVGRYAIIGRTYVVHINLVTGSTTTYGSGVYSFALPVAAANVGATYVGKAHLLGSAGRYSGDFVISPAATTASPTFPDSSLTPITRHSLWNPTVPLTFGSGDQMRITVVYEGAS